LQLIEERSELFVTHVSQTLRCQLGIRRGTAFDSEPAAAWPRWIEATTSAAVGAFG
jgi:hypothetical protein